jgi:hypothetical protein
MGTSGVTGTGGGAPTSGGAANASGGANTGGMNTGDGGPDASTGGDGGRCTPVEPTDIASSFKACPADVCPAGDSVCVPNTVLTSLNVAASSLALLADCDSSSKCVPTFFVNRQNKFIPKSCRSLSGVEGRCISSCIPQVADQKDLLPKADCASTELCAPCYDPRTGEDTNACRQGCDEPTEPPPPKFAECCTGKGLCVPADLAGAQASNLGKDSCTSPLLCAPKELTDPKFRPKSCSSVGSAEGRCLSTCIPLVSSQIDQLPTAGCTADERCAPCFDPRDCKATGACTVNGDAPADTKCTPFAECCGTKGLCVPPALAGSAAKSLGKDSCSGDDLCAPKELTDATYKPKTCSSLNDAEGRCLSTCVPLVSAQASLLPSAGCGQDERCAPCLDPRTCADTGACSINGDKAARGCKQFPACCSDRGLCVSPELAGNQAANLAKDTCATGSLCAPKELTDPTFKPKACQSLGGFEGRCVSNCLGGQVAAQKDRLPTAGCATNEVCAPCYDPISGQDTGACAVNGDKPNGPKQTFTPCCDNGEGTKVGVCIPPSLAGSQASLLKQDTCATDLLCAPNTKARDPSYKFPGCVGLGTGACVPKCILDSTTAGLLSRVTCGVGEVCAPCAALGIFPTGACD